MRARVRDDLVALAARLAALDELEETERILETRDRDYRWKLSVTRAALAVAVGDELGGLSYGNFKQRCRSTLGPDRERQLHEVWAVMRELQKDG